MFQAEKYLLMGFLSQPTRLAIIRKDLLKTTDAFLDIFSVAARLSLNTEMYQLMRTHFARYYSLKRNHEPSRNLREFLEIRSSFPLPVIDQILQRAVHYHQESENVERQFLQDAERISSEMPPDVVAFVQRAANLLSSSFMERQDARICSEDTIQMLLKQDPRI